MIHCDPLRDKHVEELDKINKYFNSKTNLTKAYGSMDNTWVQKQLSALFLHTNHIPLNPDFVPRRSDGKHDLSVYKQMRAAIDKWDKSLSKGVNSFESMVRTPSGIYSKNPVTIRFNNKISSILNSERKNKAVYVDNIKSIAENLKEVMSVVNTKGGSYKKTSKALDRVYDKISESVSNKNPELASQYISQLNNILKSKDSQRILERYVDMMENMGYDDLNAIQKNPSLSNMDKQIALSMVNMVKESKDLLNTMGEVNIIGLNKMKDVVKRYFSKTDSNLTSSIMNNVDDAIKRVREGMKEGKYFPHYHVEGLLDIEQMIENIDPFKITNDSNYRSKALQDINRAVRQIPSTLKAASREKSQLFQMDPIKVLESYSQNAAMFNKKQFLMDAYLEAMNDLQPRNADFDGLESMAEYISHKYTATMKGYTDASETVKSVSSAVAKLQTASKMGLSLTGAVRNSTQAFWYILNTGFRRYKKGKKLLKTNDTYFYSNNEKEDAKRRDIQTIISDVSKEAGYFFDSATAEIISKGGITNIDGVDKKNIQYDTDENGNPFIRYKQDGAWRKIDKQLSKATAKSLMFHQYTENIVRSDVYKNAFANHFDMLFKNEAYKNRLVEDRIKAAKENGRTLSEEAARKSAHKQIEQDSHNMALNWVRMTQFEYTTPDRPNLFGGGTTNASVIGNSLFQFFPYAAHMFEMNKRVYTEGLRALGQGDLKSWKFGAMARMFGFQTLGVGLASIVLNNEFKYLIENDTFSRLENLYGLLTAEDSQEMSDVDFGNGLAQQFSGPVVSDMLFWMEAAGISQTDDGGLQQLLFGFQDFENMAESEQQRAKWNRISVSLAKVLKSRESFISGDIMGIIRNNLLLYPSERTQQGREKLFELLGMETNTQKRRADEQKVQSTLTNLPEEQRQKILGIISDLKEPSEESRGIPAGLQNLSIR